MLSEARCILPQSKIGISPVLCPVGPLAIDIRAMRNALTVFDSSLKTVERMKDCWTMGVKL